ncbi:MAG: hypothetical protein IJQ10_01160 [Clostridia bacterium]|nr:hypothetical protein [Clostridia bacterium]
MKRFGKNKIALFLAFASVLSGKTQAMNEPKSHQILAAVGGRLVRIKMVDLLIG